MQHLKLLLLVGVLGLSISCENEDTSAIESDEQKFVQQQIAASEAAVATAEAELIEFEEEWVELRNQVLVPAGSVDALADAITSAGIGGTVILAAGEHIENAPVVIDQRVKLEGEDGAVLSFPNSPEPANVPVEIVPALHVKDATRVWLHNFSVQTGTGLGGRVGILVQSGARTRIEGLHIVGFQYGILLDGGDRCQVIGNTVVGAFAEYPNAGLQWGITNSTGQRTVLLRNEVSNFNTGIFLSDRNGLAFSNRIVGGGVGILWCTVPAWQSYPDGSSISAAEPARNWRCYSNVAIANYWNYLIIDGANNSVSIQNESIDAGLYDIELAAATERFGIPSPTSANSLVVSVGDYIDYRIKDCTGDNTIVGGQLVDNTADPCF